VSGLGLRSTAFLGALGGAGGWTVQSGSATLDVGTASTDVTITAVSLSRAFALTTVRTPTVETPSVVSADLTTTTNLRLERGSSSVSVVVEWMVVEFAAGAGTVTKYTGSWNTTATTSVTVSSVTLAESFVVVSSRSTGNSNIGAFIAVGYLSSATNLALRRFDTSATDTSYAAYVVSVPGASVQQGETTIALGANTRNVTLSAVDLTRTFALVSRFSALPEPGQTGRSIAIQGVRGRLSGTTNLQLTRGGSSTTNSVYVSYAVVQMPVGATVQQQTETGFTTATKTSTLSTAVTLSKAVIFPGGSVEGPSTANNSNFLQGYNTLKLTSTTVLESQANTAPETSGAFTASVVEW
jgi:hypothetical protein